MRLFFVSWLLLFFALGTVPLFAALTPGLPTDAQVGCGKFTTRKPNADETTIDSVPYIITEPGKYILTSDISGVASPIAIQASNVVLDLNGHTVTWGKGVKLSTQESGVITYNSRRKGNVGHAAILSPSRPDATDDFSGFQWGGKLSNVLVHNGKVIDGGGTDLAYSTGIDLGGVAGAEVKNIIVEVAADDCFGIKVGPESSIHHVTVLHKTRTVTNRHAQLASIDVALECDVHHCFVLESPQEGIKARSGSKVHHNLIRLKTTVTNGYGVIGYGQSNISVYCNRIENFNGRGIHLSEKSSGWDVYDNYVEVRETGNSEYQRMQSHGIKLEGTRNSRIHDNTVLCVSSDGGEPTGLNMDLSSDSGNRIYNNTFVAMTINHEGAYAVYTVASDGTGAEVCDNTFCSNNHCVCISPDGGRNHTFRRCTFRKIFPEDEVPFLLARIYKKQNNTNFRFIDCRFLDGIDPRTHYMPGKEASWRSPTRYLVCWSLNLQVADGDTPAAGATVTVRDNSGKTVAARSTCNDAGQLVLELTEFELRYDIEPPRTNIHEGAPYTVTISHGNKTRTFTVTPKTPLAAKVDLKGSGEIAIIEPQIDEDNQIDTGKPYWRYRAEKAWADREPGRLGKWFDSETDD